MVIQFLEGIATVVKYDDALEFLPTLPFISGFQKDGLPGVRYIRAPIGQEYITKTHPFWTPSRDLVTHWRFGKLNPHRSHDGMQDLFETCDRLDDVDTVNLAMYKIR